MNGLIRRTSLWYIKPLQWWSCACFSSLERCKLISAFLLRALGYVALNCDNCLGQNKNTVTWYLVWRSLTKHYRSITLNFLDLQPHEVCFRSVFWLLKKKYCHSVVGCLDDMARVVTTSTSDSWVNLLQPIGDEQGSVVVVCYKWQEFRGRVLIREVWVDSYNLSFCFSGAAAGAVRLLAALPEVVEVFQPVLERTLPAQVTPRTLPPQGLSRERVEYPTRTYGGFCPQFCRDIVYPELPMAHQGSSSIKPGPSVISSATTKVLQKQRITSDRNKGPMLCILGLTVLFRVISSSGWKRYVEMSRASRA